MDSVHEYNSVDELIEKQNDRLNELRQMICLMGDQKYLVEELKTIAELVSSIQSKIDMIKSEKAIAYDILDKYEKSQIEIKALDEKLNYIDQNLPERVNKILLVNDTSELDFTINNTTVDSCQPTKRHLDFANSIYQSAQKKSVIYTEMQYLTRTEYESIPKYMVGRVSYETINIFIDKINECLDKKYQILSSSKSNLKRRMDVDKFNLYKRQECSATKGTRFFTLDDLKDVLGGRVDKQSLNLLTMLRHTKHVREVREGGLLRYIKNG